MSDPAIPTHLEAEVAEFERGLLDDDFDRRMTLFSDLIVSGAVSGDFEPLVQQAIADGHLSPAGDRLAYDGEDGTAERDYNRL